MSDNPIVELVRKKVADSSRPFTIIAEFKAPPGIGDDVAEVVAKSDLVRLSRAEPGCLYYDIARDADFPEKFVVLESWQNEEALAAHVLTSHFKEGSMSIASLLNSAPTVRVFTTASL